MTRTRQSSAGYTIMLFSWLFIGSILFTLITATRRHFIEPADEVNYDYQEGIPNLRQFWNAFGSSAAQLEELFRRWPPEAHPLAEPATRRVPHPPLPLPPSQESEYSVPSENMQPPKRKPGYEREPLNGHDDRKEPFVATEFFDDPNYDEAEDFGLAGFGAMGFDSFGAGGLFHAIGIPQTRLPKPWWQGPNVCVTREEVIEDVDKTSGTSTVINNDKKRDSRQMSSASASTFFTGIGEGTYRVTTCQQTPSKYSCTTVVKEGENKKSSTVTHQCCHGYLLNRSTCRRVKLNDVVTTARRMGATMFAQTIEASGVDLRSMKRKNVTLFAPSDEAFQRFDSRMLEQNEVEVYMHDTRRRRETEGSTEQEEEQPSTTNSTIQSVIPFGNDLKDIVLSHMVSGIIDLRDVTDEQVLYTENEKNSTIRVNVCSGNSIFDQSPTGLLVTTNCVPVRTETPAENGVLAIVEGVLMPVTRSLQDLITENPQLATFKKVLEQSGEWGKMVESGPWTVFAPTEEAFKRLPGDMLNRLLEGDACTSSVVRHHVVKFTLCTACVRGEMSTVSMAGETLTLSRSHRRVDGNEVEELTVENAVIFKTDISATNGVLHLTDAVVMPKSARSLSQALTDRGLSSLVRALGARNLLETMDSMKNVTFFAPTESALRSALRTDEEIPSRDTLMYHLVDKEITSCEFNNNLTLRSQLSEVPLRMKLFQTMPTFSVGPVQPTIQCARIVNVDEMACGAVLHELDRVMTPPVGNIVQTLEKDGRFTILLDFIKGTRYETRVIENGAPFSLLAPIDEAMKRLTVEQLEKLKENKELRETLLSRHIISDVICCDGIATPLWPFINYVRTDFGTSLPLKRGPSGSLQVGPLSITQCDIMATNGVIHVVDAVNMNSGSKRRAGAVEGVAMRSSKNPNVEVQIFGL